MRSVSERNSDPHSLTAHLDAEGDIKLDTEKEPSIMACEPHIIGRAIDDADEEFEPCADCDRPDACADFGCAIKAGIYDPIL